MKQLILNDGTQFEVDDISTLDEISITTDTETMKSAVEKITTESLNHATLDSSTINNSFLNSISVVPMKADSETVTIIFYLAIKSEMVIINERLDEQDVALMELAELIVG